MKDISLWFLRGFIILVLISFAMSAFVRCTVESKDESITVLSYQSDVHFGDHLNNVIPIKTIASDSILEEVDIVYFDSLYKYEENKDKVEILDSVSVYTPLVAYVPQNFTTQTANGRKVDFSDIIQLIESGEITNNVLVDNNYPIQMDKLENRSIFAFYTLLFNYYSNGKIPEELSANELEEIIQQIKAFVKDNQGGSDSSIIFSKYKVIKDGYVYFHFNETTLVEEVLVAVSENGVKYLKEIKEEFFSNSIDLSKYSIIRVAEYQGILNQFITPLKQTYEYESEYDAFGFWFGCIWIVAIAIILIACGIACMRDIYEEIGIELLAYAANIVLALIFRNKVSVTILPVIAFLFLVLSIIPESLFEKIGTKIDCIIEKWRNKSKKKDVENEIGEANAKLYQETLKKADELILINKEFGIEENVWEAIKNFLEQNPKSLTCIKNVFDLNVTFFVLEVYHNCPKNSDGHLNLDNDRRTKIKEILMQLNQKALKAFENAKELYYLDLDSSIKIAESNLKGSSMF